MISYNRRKQVKFFLFIGASIIGLISIFLINNLVNWVEQEEREKIILWADAVQRKGHLVEYTKNLFDKLKDDERRKAEIWSSAMQRLSDENSEGDLTFLVKIISSNKNIPGILTDKYGNISSTINLDFEIETGIALPDSIKYKFSKYPPIPVLFERDTISFLYYNDSHLFSELQNVMNNYLKSFISEVVSNTSSVPVIITDQSKKIVLGFGNIDSTIVNNPNRMASKLIEMEANQNFISINQGNNYVFFEESTLLKSLKYYPILFIIIVIVYLLISYLAFTSSRKYEQNQVWVGMSKETAHQLGTPISSLMAWVELLKMKDVDQSIITEINKDTQRLTTIADRFSKIGSTPILKNDDLILNVKNATEYLQRRAPKSISFKTIAPSTPIIVPLNKSLFDWVIENICKNAIDAIEKDGAITLTITENTKNINLDISDTGKGISRSKLKTVFKPGFTTKTRGWGLGLTLAKRIIEEYHNGKIFIKNSEVNKGTTFRIILPKTVDI